MRQSISNELQAWRPSLQYVHAKKKMYLLSVKQSKKLPFSSLFFKITIFSLLQNSLYE